MERERRYFWKKDGIELRLINEEDVSFFEEILKNTKLRRQAEHGIGLPGCPACAEDMVAYALHGIETGSALWFMVLNDEGERVGYTLLDWMDERNGNAGWQVTILEAYRRKGYATAAVRILLAYLFEERRFQKAACCVMEDNNEGLAFVKKLGFYQDGLRTEIFYTTGVYLGEYYYSLLREEYEKGLFCRQEEALWLPHAGKKQEHTVHSASLFDDRPYFWCYDGITLRDMQKQDYLINHEMIYDTESCIFYESDVKLPECPDELTVYEEEHLAFGQEDDRIEFAIEDAEGNYAGNINLCGLDEKNGKFSFSIYILPQYRGKGYAAKALKLLLSYAFFELRMHKMISRVNVGNEASAALMRSVGCHAEGILRKEEYYHGNYMDVIMYGVTAEKFRDFLERDK